MSNPENQDEKLARKWLVSLAGDPGSVRRSEHEPPDYVLNGEIAVEVTRISEGDETSLHSLGPVVEDVLKDLGPPGHGRSLAVFWVYEPSRCFPTVKAMKRQIRNVLMPYTERCADPEKLRDLSLGESQMSPCLADSPFDWGIFRPPRKHRSSSLSCTFPAGRRNTSGKGYWKASNVPSGRNPGRSGFGDDTEDHGGSSWSIASSALRASHSRGPMRGNVCSET